MSRLTRILLVYSLLVTAVVAFLAGKIIFTPLPEQPELEPAIANLEQTSQKLETAAQNTIELHNLMEDVKNELILFRADINLEKPSSPSADLKL